MKNRGTINGNINGNINSDLSKNELSLIGVIIQKPGITLTEAAEILGVSKRTASRIFASLQEKGCVKREGKQKRSLEGCKITVELTTLIKTIQIF